MWAGVCVCALSGCSKVQIDQATDGGRQIERIEGRSIRDGEALWAYGLLEPLDEGVCANVGWGAWLLRYGAAEAIVEHGLAILHLDPESFFVDRPMVSPTDHHQVVEARLASLGPMPDVVAIDEEPIRAGGETTSSIA